MQRRNGWSYVAAMDPGTRGNAWTLIVATSDGKRTIVAAHREWRGTTRQPLLPDVVFREIAEFVDPWGVRMVHTDQHGYDGYAAIARMTKIQIAGTDKFWTLSLVHHAITQGMKLSLYDGLAVALKARALAIPRDRQLRADLLGIRRRITPTGMNFELVSTPDGRHSDYAQPVAMVVSLLHIPDPRPVPESPAAVIEADIERRQRKQFGPKRGPRALPALQQLPRLPK